MVPNTSGLRNVPAGAEHLYRLTVVREFSFVRVGEFLSLLQLFLSLILYHLGGHKPFRFLKDFFSNITHIFS